MAGQAETHITLTMFHNKIWRARMNPPVFKATLRGSQLTFVCPHCSKPKRPVEHLHGMPAGPKAAHCHVPDSPYVRSGYILELEDTPAT
jgi:hypothetical protein